MTEHMTAEEYQRMYGLVTPDRQANPNVAPKKRAKYNNEWTEYNGRKYQSKLEARYAENLDTMKKLGIVSLWFPQQKIPITKDRKTNHVVDFLILYSDGTWEFVDTKGQDTPEGKRNRKIVKDQHGIDIGIVYKVKL